MKEKTLPAKQVDNTQRLFTKVVRLRQRIQQRLKGKTLPPPEEVIAKMREERTKELLDSLKD